MKAQTHGSQPPEPSAPSGSHARATEAAVVPDLVLSAQLAVETVNMGIIKESITTNRVKRAIEMLERV